MVELATTVLVLALFSSPVPTADAQSGAPVAQGQEAVVYITGDVSKPGRHPLTGSMTVVQLVALAGGLLPSADRGQLVIVDGTSNDEAGSPCTRTVSYRDILKGKDLAKNNVKLRPGDVVIVRRTTQPR